MRSAIWSSASSQRDARERRRRPWRPCGSPDRAAGPRRRRARRSGGPCRRCSRACSGSRAPPSISTMRPFSTRDVERAGVRAVERTGRLDRRMSPGFRICRARHSRIISRRSSRTQATPLSGLAPPVIRCRTEAPATLHCARRGRFCGMEGAMTFGDRVVGAMKLDANAFEDVERDPTAIGQSVGVIVLAAVAAGIGKSLRSGCRDHCWRAVTVAHRLSRLVPHHLARRHQAHAGAHDEGRLPRDIPRPRLRRRARPGPCSYHRHHSVFSAGCSRL